MIATLSGLTIGSLTLAPAFDPEVKEYTATTTNATNTITATPSDPAAVVSLNLNDENMQNGTSATWIDGTNVLIVSVVNETVSEVYSITVTKT